MIILIVLIILVIFYLKYRKKINESFKINEKKWISDIWIGTNLDPKNINFVQIGSNCGTTECAVCGEPIWEDCKKNLWKGIVVEPIPHVFDILKKNYSYNKNVKAFNCAISDKKGKIKMYIPKGKILDNEASSLSKKHVMKHFNSEIEEIEVDGYTLTEFWEKNVNYEKVDILNLDCEGFDHIIINSTDFSKLNPKPKYILFENHHIPIEKKKETLEHLKKYNYEFVKKVKGCSIDDMDILVKLIE